LEHSSERTHTHDVSFWEGCYADGEMAYYKPLKSSDVGGPTSKETFNTFNLQNVKIELHSKKDPYVEFTQAEETLGNDLSLLFWVSIVCVVISAILILALAIVFCTQTDSKNHKRKSRHQELHEAGRFSL
jgi:hypothetical protein